MLNDGEFLILKNFDLEERHLPIFHSHPIGLSLNWQIGAEAVRGMQLSGIQLLDRTLLRCFCSVSVFVFTYLNVCVCIS